MFVLETVHSIAIAVELVAIGVCGQCHHQEGNDLAMGKSLVVEITEMAH